ncbi:MAG: 2,3,4,5-tetrahydropyridine-2,6-dicarboxylate N-succinyltransferase [Bacteriovoracaceae bacterium]|jgi:2,3,4,5-tetrahydropyridine-2-carboxylate N-succinyltransferase|nr:2,3,4,5-tetrahydropyridine-2,6-dicarboxylate N-succinyltransferase [Halobacteriovoraceae bacterium]MDP7320114.1 2,3,4,5-tetrahydropyridine-2,6-dicarboxylate N-succinyltransferase [Bacteriovoracaceae bacterium]|tara:strand:- start:120 stop:872 length:753 start_codon:yes stop_codon:yes gene_type:complete
MDWEKVLDQFETGEVRAANKIDGKWVANKEAKQAILAAFKAGELKEFSDTGFRGFVDKHNLPAREFKPENKIRMVPGGSSVRRGAYVSSGVIIMPPAYINVGAYVDEGSMVDSHALVGSCAQIGKNVHLSAAVQIGGVLEPIGASPVIVEDNCFVGAGAVIVEGIQVLAGAVIAPGVILSKGTPIYDAVNEKQVTDGIIPEGAVVVPGTRPVSAKLNWAKEMGLSLNCAIIVKYRDEKTDGSLQLEEFLR